MKKTILSTFSALLFSLLFAGNASAALFLAPCVLAPGDMHDFGDEIDIPGGAGVMVEDDYQFTLGAGVTGVEVLLTDGAFLAGDLTLTSLDIGGGSVSAPLG